MGFPGGSVLKNPPAMQDAQVQSLGEEGSLEEGMATLSRILAQETPWTEEPGPWGQENVYWTVSTAGVCEAGALELETGSV